MTMKISITLEFENVTANSPESEEILRSIYSSLETIQIGFDAQGCGVGPVVYTEDSTADEA